MVRCRIFDIFLLCLVLTVKELSASYQGKCPFAHFQQECGHPVLGLASVAAAAFAEVDSEKARKSASFSVNALGTSLYSILATSEKSDKLKCAAYPRNCVNNTKNYYYRTFDGSCNNLRNGIYGMAKTRYARMLTPKYSDGSYAPTSSITGVPLPNARLLSLTLYGEQTLPDDFRTMACLQWGQMVAHDLTHFAKGDAPDDCCENPDNKFCYPITLHPRGPIALSSTKKCLNFARSTSDADAVCSASGAPYSEKISVATAYLDLSSAYGNSLEQSRKTRLFKRGLLRTTLANNREWLPVSSNTDGECGEGNYQCYDIPDMRNQFIPTIAVLHTIILREHNRIANILEELNPHYSDERLFQEARKINIAQFQKITYYDWLPQVIGHSYAYEAGLCHYSNGDEYVHDYDATVNVAPYAEFAAGAFRYAHNQIPGWFSMVAPDRNYNRTMRLSDYFERPENVNLLSDGDNFDSLIRGMATQLQKRPDSNIDKEIKHYFDRKNFEEFGSDLKALDIQRGRDYGLPSYNDMRQYCGLPRAYDWSGFVNEISADKISLMQRLYASPDDVDLSVGGALESHVADAILGPTFQCIIGRQFLKVRVGDRFFFEHDNGIGGFTKEQLAEIRKASLSALFCNNADFLQSIQTNAFIFPNTRNILRSCKSIPQINFNLWKATTQQATYLT